jgi:hypothetical protein
MGRGMVTLRCLAKESGSRISMVIGMMAIMAAGPGAAPQMVLAGYDVRNHGHGWWCPNSVLVAKESASQS